MADEKNFPAGDKSGEAEQIINEEIEKSEEVEENVAVEEKRVPSEDGKVKTSREVWRDFDDGDFWDMGEPRKKTYSKPSFSPGSLDVADVERVKVDLGGGKSEIEEKAVYSREAIPKRDSEYDPEMGKTLLYNGVSKLVKEIEAIKAKDDSSSGEKKEKKPVTVLIGGEDNRDVGSSGRVIRTVDGQRSVSGYSYGSYSRARKQRRVGVGDSGDQSRLRRGGNTDGSTVQREVKYEPGGAFIKGVTIKDWSSETDFYSRFAEDVEVSRKRVSRYPYTVDIPEVKFFSYVPQFSHMTRSQIEYYDWVKECIAHGKYPECDLSYIQLYVFELINEPDGDAGENNRRAEVLTALLLKYQRDFRDKYPLFMCNLSDWLADYCLIHEISVPSGLIPYLPEIVARSQIKEFYLDGIFREYSGDEVRLYRSLTDVFTYSMSDYDYKTSRYYTQYKSEYDELIPGAVAAVLKSQYEGRRGIFGFGRTYRMVRDSYVGAVASIRSKKRIELELSSCIRLESTRDIMTKAIKYSENKVREAYGLKSKLLAKQVDIRDADVIDRYFAPVLEKSGAKRKKSLDEKYMPEGYMANYEAETAGFDVAAAEAIERESWVNTERLVVAEEDADLSMAADEVGGDTVAIGSGGDGGDAGNVVDWVILGAVKAALDGRFRQYAREAGIYEGELTDRVNTVFLEVIGDVLIEDGEVIEDYRDDAVEWVEKNGG